MTEKDRRHYSENTMRERSPLVGYIRRVRNSKESLGTQTLDNPGLIDNWGDDLIGYRDLTISSLPRLEADLGVAFLARLLNKYNIPIVEWGKDANKTLRHLYDELTTQESLLTGSSNGKIIRLVRAVGVDVFYQDYTGNLYRLLEDSQVFETEKKRSRRLKTSVAEKVFPGEDIEIAARRAIREELGISGDLRIRADKLVEDSRMSNSYPGLPSKYKYYLYNL